MTNQIDYNGMDVKIEKKSRFPKKIILIAICPIIIFAGLLWLIFRDTSSSMNVNKGSITIATVEKGEFNDYIRVAGQVIPDHIIYLDAIEGGRVEERLIEEGTQVKAGDVIIRLSNPLLNIGILQSEANLTYQENELRNTRLNMEQEHLRLKQERIGLNKDLIQKNAASNSFHIFTRRICPHVRIICKLRKITIRHPSRLKFWMKESDRTRSYAAISFKV